MKELNELATIPQPFYAVTQYGKAVMIPAEDGQWLNKTAVAEAFLTLAQERDSWKQRAEAAEASAEFNAKRCKNLVEMFDKRGEELLTLVSDKKLTEAKLAELEKQEPRHFYREHPIAEPERQALIAHNRAEIKAWIQIENSTGNLDELCKRLRDSAIIALASLEAEPEIEVAANDVLSSLFEVGTRFYTLPPFADKFPAINLADLVPDETLREVARAWSHAQTPQEAYPAMRAAILRKIEEQSQ